METLRLNWTVQRQPASAFSSISCDQAIEQTCNRDSKTKGGLIGITMNKGTVNFHFPSKCVKSIIDLEYIEKKYYYTIDILRLGLVNVFNYKIFNFLVTILVYILKGQLDDGR